MSDRVSHAWRTFLGHSLAAAAVMALAACSGGAVEPGEIGSARQSALIQPAPGQVVYPNVASDVSRSKAPLRSAAEVRAMERNLMSLAASQDDAARNAGQMSATDQLKAMARRNKAIADEDLQPEPKN